MGKTALKQHKTTPPPMDSQRQEDPARLLSRSILELLFREPFYAHVIQSLTREFTTDIETAAVTVSNGQVRLLINPGFLAGLTSDIQRAALLKHEILHVVLGHLTRPENKAGHSRLLLNLAADLVVNQLIDPDHLPPGAITLKSFLRLKLLPGKNMAYYIDKLKDFPELKILAALFENCHSDHDHWQDADADSAAANRIAITAFREKVLAIGKQHGTIPGDLSAQLNLDTEAPAAITWRDVLRRFIHRTGLTSIRFTRKRISRRFGTRPGLRVEKQLRLLVAIDTSGSISNDNLREFFGEIRNLGRLISDLWVVECDSRIQRMYRYTRSETISVKGRGGTDLNPVFTLVNQSPGRFDAIVYLTDGFTSQPTVTPVVPALLVINNEEHSLKPSGNLSIIEF